MLSVMTALQALDLGPAHGVRLSSADYKRDFWPRDERAVDRDSWKLERRPDFQERDSPSHDAMRGGDWEEALRLIEAGRERLSEIGREDRAKRHFFHRVRVVEKPFTPYLQWELHSLRLRDECGIEIIRLVDAAKLSHLETSGLLPELVVLADEVLYEVRYTDEGLLDGAMLYTDPDVVARGAEFLSGLYALGEGIQSFFEREVAPLPPPTST